MILYLIGIAILLFIIIVLSIQFSSIVFGGYAPFFLTKSKVIKRIMEEIKVEDGDSVYELGCGNAGFLRAIEKKFPKVKELIGAEKFLMPYLIGKIQTSFLKSRIKILKEDIFNMNLRDADVIYCFLNKPMMQKLKEKLKKECEQGTQIISYQFTLPDLAPERIIDLEENEKDKIFFYKI
jgi:hypothetical protein